MEDIRQGTQTYKDLQEANSEKFQPLSDKDFEEYLNNILQIPLRQGTNPYQNATQYVSNGSDTSSRRWGESIYDTQFNATEEEFFNPENTRGERQSWYAQVGAGIAKGAVLAGTTFANGTAGMAVGIGDMLVTWAEGKKENESDDDFSARVRAQFWDNPFSQTMQAINDWSENAMPNYYTDEEKNRPWYENIFTANFLGDKFIKNLGFSVGAFYGGGVHTAALKAIKLPQLIGAVTKSVNATRMVSAGVGATLSAVNEASFEALNNSTDWKNLKTAEVNDSFEKEAQKLLAAYENNKGKTFVRVPNGTEGGYIIQDKAEIEYRAALQNLDAQRQEALAKVNTDAYKMGNADLLMNIPILMASNVFQFGKLYANGFRTGRRALNITMKEGKYVGETTMGKGVAKGIGNAMMEGTEEISQKGASEIAGNYYAKDVSNYVKAKIDPDAEQATLSWANSFIEGLTKTVTDSSSWEEFFIGAFTGALGIPSFHRVRASDGSMQSPIRLEGGIIGEIRDTKEKIQREAEISDRMNKRVQSPEFVNYYQGLIRHYKYQKDMDDAVERDDEFDFKNAELAQFISDINMFDQAGRLEDLKDLITSSFDISDENLQSIVDNTTAKTTDASGKEVSVGPFVDRNGNALFSTPEGKKEMIKKLTETKDKMLSDIESYNKIKNELDSWSNQSFSDEQLEELVWLKSQLKDWQDRSVTLASELKPTLQTLLGNIDQITRHNDQIMYDEDQKSGDLTEAYKKADEENKTLKRLKANLEALRTADPILLASFIASNKDLAEDLKTLVASNLMEYTEDERQTFNKKVDDVGRLANAKKYYKEKLDEYLKNPGALQKDIDEAKEKVATDEKAKQKTSLKDDLKSSTNVTDFRNKINKIESSKEKVDVLKELEDEGFELAKTYREMNKYRSEVLKAINDLKVSPEIKEDALKLFEAHFAASENLEQLANPSAETLKNDTVLHDPSLSEQSNYERFLTAQYYLLTAIKNANNSKTFADKFSSAYREFTIEPLPSMTKSEEKPKSKSKKKESTPSGNITSSDMTKENKETADNTPGIDQSKSTEKRPFYRPVIPELHILASKQGDFRPFNVVVKEREGKDFDYIYNYLKQAGAFEYVNKGNLSVDSEIGFMIDPSFEEGKPNEDWKKTPTIFIIDKKNGQIVGSLDEADSQINSFEGLASLVNKIKGEYSKADKNNKFIASSTTKVRKIMNGKVPYGNTEYNLGDIPNVVVEGKEPVFGIIKNGVLVPSKKVDAVAPKDVANKEGRLYLLIPNADGRYTPIAVRVKHFNKQEYNPEDAALKDKSRMKFIQQAIGALSLCETEEDLSKAVSQLSKVLFTGDLHVNLKNTKQGQILEFGLTQRDNNGNILKDDKGHEVRKKFVVYLDKKSEEPEDLGTIGSSGFVPNSSTQNLDTGRKDAKDIAKEITDGLLDLNLPLQVSIEFLQEQRGYINELLTSDMLTSNITNAAPKGAWFITDFVNEKGEIVKAEIPTPKTPITTSTNPVGGNESATPGIKINANLGTYYVDVDTKTLYYENGTKVGDDKINNTYKQLYIDLATAEKLYGNKKDGVNLINNKYITPSGKVVDRSTKKYLNDEEATKVKAEYEKKSKPTSTLASTPTPSISGNESEVKITCLIDGTEYTKTAYSIGKVADIDLYIVNHEVHSKGLGSSDMTLHDWYIVFPNGKTFKTLANESTNTSIENVKQRILTAVKKKPDKVKQLASETTSLSGKQIVTPITTNYVGTPSATGESAAAKTAKKEQAVNAQDSEFENDLTLERKANGEPVQIWDKEKELKWLNKVLPQLTKENRVKFVKGLINVAKKGSKAWGQFNGSIITLSDIAAEGTTYHEAFHVVFNLLLSEDERNDLLKEARKLYGKKNDILLEEDLAEGFREYVMNRDTNNIFKKIKNFFEDLYIKVSNWAGFGSHINAYYLAVNNGNYARNYLPSISFSTTNNDARYREVTDPVNVEKEKLLVTEAQRFLDNFDIKINDLGEYNSDVPLFDAINRSINPRTVKDVSDGVGYAVAFMMQYNPKILELVAMHKQSDKEELKKLKAEISEKGEATLNTAVRIYRNVDKDLALKEIGKDIAIELRKLYGVEKIEKPSNTYIQKIWKVITAFFEKLTPRFRTTVETISRNTRQIANAIKLNDASIIRVNQTKPGTNTPASLVDISKALLENPYEDSIVRTLQKYNIALAGSACIAASGALFRPAENPLHDLDFSAYPYNKQQLDAMMVREFPHHSHIRTIEDKETGDKTETYLILDRDFKVETPAPGMAAYSLIDSHTGEFLGTFVNSELALKDGVRGKFLDFFVGPGANEYGSKTIVMNNTPYLFSDFRNALSAKVKWQRLKDIWDYNRYVGSDKLQTLEELKAQQAASTKDKLKKAQVIWGHPAIGKTTYLENNDDILEWDDIVNPRRFAFIRNVIDPNHTMDTYSAEYNTLQHEYLANWNTHPEYVEFLTREWKNLVERGKREHKKVFASPLPLLEIGRDDIDLIVAIGNAEFEKRNMDRGGSKYGTRQWKEALDDALVRQDPNKIVYTNKYFSEFMRENLGVTWGTLTKDELPQLQERGWTKEQFDSVSQEERDQALNCIAF